MFGYDGGEPKALLTAMIAERTAARARWPFLTSLDLSSIHNETQLATMVKDRTGESAANANRQVHEWIDGYESRVAIATSVSAASIERWTDDGGAARPSASSVAR
jgi:hypothetical protein